MSINKGYRVDAAPHRWLCVGRVSIGLSYDEKEHVCSVLEKQWTRTRLTPPPPSLVFHKEMPDFWLPPDNSIVLQVRATELIRSTDYGTPYTLRFPRVVRIRNDKPVGNIMTLGEFNQLTADKGAVIKLSKKQVNQEQMSEVNVKRRKRNAKELKVADQFRTQPSAEVEVVSKALLGRKLYVLSDDEDCAKVELAKIVESHGGKHVGNIVPDLFCCVAGRTTPRVRSLIEAQHVDMTTTAWLRSLPKSNTPCTLLPLDMLSIKPSTRLNLSRDFDVFGISYKEDVDVATLKRCFDKMENHKPHIYLTRQEMLDIDNEIGENPYSFLRPCCIHFTSNNRLLQIQAKKYSALLCDILSPLLTHVVVPKEWSRQRVAVVRRETGAHIVSEDWVAECVGKMKLVNERAFYL